MKPTDLSLDDIVVPVARGDVRMGYGAGGKIVQIGDPLPAQFWQHPAHGFTPLVRSRIPGLEGVLIKYEGSQISGSFKDRMLGVTLAEILARDPDLPGVVVPSSGNAAVAAAMVCARAGLPMIAVVPNATPQARVAPTLARGALVVRAGEGPSDAYRFADRLAEALGFVALYSTFASPWAEWACRGAGREIAMQTDAPIRQLVVPVSAGPLMVGIANGLMEAGLPLPRLVAAQSAGCAPIARAFSRGDAKVVPWTGPVETQAGAIADRLEGYPQDGTRTLFAVRTSGGAAIAVGDAEMAAARRALLRHDGIDAEFSACAGIAWLMGGGAAAGDTVCVVTASGFKHTFAGDVPESGDGDGAALDRLRAALARLGEGAVV